MAKTFQVLEIQGTNVSELNGLAAQGYELHSIVPAGTNKVLAVMSKDDRLLSAEEVAAAARRG